MAKIYSERETSELYHSTGEPGVGVEARRVAGYGKQLEAQSEQYERRAKDSYSKALNIEWQNSMNEMANNPTLYNNPTAFAKEVKKLNEKMSSEIVDDDVKVDFLVNSEIKGASYITNAQNNFIKAQAEREKSILFDSIYNGIETRNLAVKNIISGNGTDNDISTFIGNDIAFQQSVNRTNPDGTYVFSNEQRLKMKRDHENAIVDAFKNAYYNTPDEQKKQFYDSVMKGGKYVVNTKDGKQIEIDAQKILKPDTFKDIRHSIRDEHHKRLADIRKEQKIEGYQAKLNFLANPTKASLLTAFALNEKMSSDERADLEEIYRLSPNYEAETTFESNSEAYSGLKDVISMPHENEGQRDNMVRKALKYAAKLTRSNTNGKLTTEKKNEYIKTLTNALADDAFAERINDLPDMNLFYSILSSVPSIYSVKTNVKQLAAQENIKKITHDLSSKMLYMASVGATNEQINDVYNKSLEDAVKAKYWYIPEIQNKPLKKGETTFKGLSGGVYIFNGFAGDDILVKKVEDK